MATPSKRVEKSLHGQRFSNRLSVLIDNNFLLKITVFARLGCWAPVRACACVRALSFVVLALLLAAVAVLVLVRRFVTISY